MKSALIETKQQKTEATSVENPSINKETAQVSTGILPFSIENANLILENFALKIKDSRPRMYNSLTGKTFELISEYGFELSFANQSQADDFTSEILNHLQGLLRRDLNNTQITIQTKVSKEENQNFIYTAEDKFKNMAGKNPALIKLKQRFGLDFE